MLNAKRIIARETAIMWLPVVIIWSTLLNQGHITIESDWLMKNEALLGLLLLSLPTVIVFVEIAIGSERMEYTKRFLVSTGLVFTFAYVVMVSAFHCDALISGIGMIFVLIPGAVDYYKLNKKETK